MRVAICRLLSLMVVAPLALADGVDRSDACVAVGIGGPPQDYACLNAMLAAEVARQAQRPGVEDEALAAVPADSPTAMGLYTQAATRERLGTGFGRSVYPQRRLRSYPNPLLHVPH